MSREMKDSGIEWIGQIPIDWEITKFRNTIERLSTGLNPRDNFTLGTGNNYYVTIRNFENRILNLDERCDKINDDAIALINKRSDLKSGDILFASISKDGQAYLIKENPVNWNINESVFTIRTKKEILNPEYAEYTLVSSYFYNNLLVGATGSTFKSIKIGDLKENTIVLPSINEQRRIADFLNIKSVLIDEIIEKTKATIEDYKLLKQSIITEAVTKGLDKNVEMKDSGIEWIGEVPKQWNVRKISSVVDTIGSGTTPKTSDESLYFGNINWIQSGDINGGIITNVSKKINQNALNSSSALRVYNGDFVVVAMYGASIGNVSISKINACVNQACCVLQSKSFNVEFLYYLMKAAKNYLVFSAAGGTQPNISQEKIKQLRIPFPSIDEQDKIAENLNGKCYEIDRLLTQKVRLLEELESYKKSLIYEYVTGKKEIE